MQLPPSGRQAAFYDLASDEQLDWVPPTTEWTAENADVHISVMADAQHARAVGAPTRRSRRATRRRARRSWRRSMRRSAEDSYRWALTLFPTHAYASEAGMSLRAFEDFYYAACLAIDGDPVTAWERQSEEVKRLSEWIQGTGGGPHPGARAPTSPSAWPAATGSPASASTTCPTASSSPRRRGRRQRRDLLLLPRRATAAGRCRASACALRTGRSSTRVRTRARTS